MGPIHEYAKECYPDEFPEPQRSQLYRRWLRYVDKNRGRVSRERILRLTGVDDPGRYRFLFNPDRVFAEPWTEETRLVFFWILCLVGVPAPCLFTGSFLTERWVGQVLDPQLLGVLASYVQDREGDPIYQEIAWLVVSWLAYHGNQNGFSSAAVFPTDNVPFAEYRMGDATYGLVYDIPTNKVLVFTSASKLCTLDLSVNFVQDLKRKLFKTTEEKSHDEQTTSVY